MAQKERFLTAKLRWDEPVAATVVQPVLGDASDRRRVVPDKVDVPSLLLDPGEIARQR
jgi:hypothetical protein